MSLDFEEILESSTYNRKGDHIIGDCPFCEKESHFYFNVSKAEKQREGKYVACWDCKKCSRSGNIVSLLKQLGKLNLLKGQFIEGEILKNKLKPEDIDSENDFFQHKEIKPPTGFKRVHSNEYLEGRGFTQLEFQKYVVGESRTLSKFLDYVFILVTVGGRTVGYVGRSKLSKEEIKKINEEYKRQGVKTRYPRYRNSTNTEFSKLLTGSEEILFTTKWVILVEGFFDKVRVDQAFKLDNLPEMKCCCCWGKSVSEEHIKILKKKGIEGVILIQDPDAVNDSKKIAFELRRHFKVLVGFTGDKDLGDSTDKEIMSAFDSVQNPVNFKLSKIQKKTLEWRPKKKIKNSLL